MGIILYDALARYVLSRAQPYVKVKFCSLVVSRSEDLRYDVLLPHRLSDLSHPDP